jgi:NitT/TauT family transport system substrate-binding protein
VWRGTGWRLVGALAALVGASCAAPSRGEPAAAPGAGMSDTPAAVAAAPAAGTPELERFRLAYPNLSASYLPMFVAQEQGYYQSEGLDVELLEMRANAGQAALMAGEVDFTASLGSNLRMALQGAPIKTILLYMKAPLFFLVAQPEYPTVAALRGRTVGVGVAGASIDQMARLTMKHFGLEPQRDVQIVSIGDGAVQYEALRLGQVDAVLMSLPFPVLARREGYAIVVNTAEILSLPTSGLGTLQSTLDRRRGAVERLARAQLRGLDYIRAEPEAGARSIAEFFGMDLDTARASYALMLPVWTADGVPDRQGIEAIVEQEVADGTIAVALPYEQLADPSIAAAARRAASERAN